jgi:hypothetical protein
MTYAKSRPDDFAGRDRQAFREDFGMYPTESSEFSTTGGNISDNSVKIAT